MISKHDDISGEASDMDLIETGLADNGIRSSESNGGELPEEEVFDYDNALVNDKERIYGNLTELVEEEGFDQDGELTEEEM